MIALSIVVIVVVILGRCGQICPAAIAPLADFRSLARSLSEVHMT